MRSVEDADGLETLPLFALNTVLFPGTWLPLRVFEPRYRQMVADCLDGDRSFGVALIKYGDEVGGPATPFGTGTVARIQEVAQDRGNFHLLVRGERRFEVAALVDGGLYPKARVRVLPPPRASAADERDAREMRLLHELYVKALHRAARTLNQRWPPELLAPIPEGDALVVANWVAWMLPTDNTEKQRLLECATVGEMLAGARGVLQADLERWEAVLRRPAPG
ncbi:MAG TPA: LON peptidase substrate-binding domain-containing protein [Candidatus Thermoplasmatota archaeon]